MTERTNQAGSGEALAGDGFYGRLPVFDRFDRLTDPAIYTPLPDHWVLGLSDIVRSTAAIDAGRYKVVNTAAASVIAAVSNGLPDTDFPFVFGGDGASFALPNAHADLGATALAAVAAWVRDELDLEVRVALVPIETIRAAGLDVRVARFAPSPDVSYAMFTGGGLAWAEERMKEGAFAIPPAAAGTRPDLTGLSCRFAEIPAERGVIVSLIVLPKPGVAPAAFSDLVARILKLAEGVEVGRPIPASGPALQWPPAGLGIEASALPLSRISRTAAQLLVGAKTLAAHVMFKTGVRLGGFDPARYRRQLVENSDFRKFDDGLRMTLDCTPALADEFEALLAGAEKSGVARCGMHRQGAALMTCFVPSPTRSDHVHFIDGAMGGYAAAARAVKVA